jgi:hypothetical protein
MHVSRRIPKLSPRPNDTAQAMTRIYLEPGVLLARPDAQPDQSPAASIVTGAAEELQTLIDTGHELVLVSDHGVDLPEGFPPMDSVGHVDAAVDGSWFLTSDPELCGPRQAHIRTILVGPGPGGHRAAVHRCDISTRDLRSAVLEILTREAMTPVA